MERLARTPQARRDGATRNGDELGDFAERQLLDFVQHEDGPLVEPECRERAIQHEPAFPQQGALFWARGWIVERLELGATRFGSRAGGRAARLRSNEQRGLEQKSFFPASLEIGKAPRRHLEHLLSCVVYRGLGDTQPPQRAPNKAKVLACERSQPSVAVDRLGCPQSGSFVDGGFCRQ